MKPGRWQLVKEIYQAALDSEPRLRKDLLDKACAGDEELRREVESLLAYQPEAKEFLESPALELAAKALARDQMKSPTVGLTDRTLGHYRIVEKIGAGGMGVVYRARDTHLDRSVAIKVLPAGAVADSERKRRFTQEAKSASALNHPNIIHIYDIDKADGTDFIAMEYVSGKTLDHLIGRKSLPIEEALKYAVQIADALAAAHAAGIVHRDLKPANIMVTDKKLVKVLDFGLAKLTESTEAGESATTLTVSPTTEQGLIVGTVSYMSPEQAEGKKIDARSDIFSFGSVLYEMLTGRRAFEADSKIGTLSAILHQEPNPIEGMPPEVEKIISRCLRKDPDRRVQHMDDLRVALDELREDSVSGKLAAPVVRSRFRLFMGLALGTLLIAALAWFLAAKLGEEPHLKIAGFIQLTDQAGAELWPSLSPDGKSFVYVGKASGNMDIYLQRVGGKAAINLTKDSAEYDSEPAFSPDGEQIAFSSERDGGGIFVMGATGESAKRLTDSGYNPAWSPDGKEIAYATGTFAGPENLISVRGSRIFIVDVASGRKQEIVGAQNALQPQWSPHGYRIAYWGLGIHTIDANGGSPASVVKDTFMNWNPVWSRNGEYLYFASNRSGSMNFWRVKVDERSGKILGKLDPVTIPSPYCRDISFSADGRRLVYMQSTDMSGLFRVGFDPFRETTTSSAAEIVRGSIGRVRPDLSPDGNWLAFTTFDRKTDLGIVKIDGSVLRHLTNTAFAPRWSPDGELIAFMSSRTGKSQIWAIRPDGSGLRQLTFDTRSVAGDIAWSPDGRRLSYAIAGTGCFIIEVGKPWSQQTPQALPSLGKPNTWFYPTSWSPDGLKIIGSGWGISGIHEMFLFSFDSGQYEQLTENSQTSAFFPQWLGDSRRILFASGSTIQLMDTRTRRIRQIYAAPDWISRMTISRDNRLICFRHGIAESDIWMATIENP